MNNIGHTLYTTIVRYAEGGGRVVKVTLPPELHAEYLSEQGMTRMMKTLGIEVVSGKVSEPEFELGATK